MCLLQLCVMSVIWIICILERYKLLWCTLVGQQPGGSCLGPRTRRAAADVAGLQWKLLWSSSPHSSSTRWQEAASRLLARVPGERALGQNHSLQHRQIVLRLQTSTDGCGAVIPFSPYFFCIFEGFFCISAELYKPAKHVYCKRLT